MNDFSVTKDIRARLKRARIACRLTQTQLGDLIGLEQPQISAYEAGHAQMISMVVLRKWILAINADANYILGVTRNEGNE